MILLFNLQYVALETSLQTEEIELYVIKECPLNIILDDAKFDPSDIKSELLTREEETLAALFPENLNCGHMVSYLFFKSCSCIMHT
jgi:E3 ubiquitin-protein ligase RNF1/2